MSHIFKGNMWTWTYCTRNTDQTAKKVRFLRIALQLYLNHIRHECSPGNCCIFSEHLFVRAPLEGFCIWYKCLVLATRIINPYDWWFIKLVYQTIRCYIWMKVLRNIQWEIKELMRNFSAKMVYVLKKLSDLTFDEVFY